MSKTLGKATLSMGLAIGLCGAQPAPTPFGVDEPWMRLRPIVGEESAHFVEPGETLHDVAYQHRMGFEAVRRLNREIDPWIPTPGTSIRLPTRLLLPPADAEGIVINIPEMRLYDFTGAGSVRVHAVAVGDRKDPTPIARFRIGTKRVDPYWRVPESIRKERPELPAVVPPSEDNPLGSRWMTLGNTSYGIHGTSVRWSIGRDSTHGCVRLYEDVMQALFDRIASGTPVEVIYEPFKWGTNGKDLFLEVHADLYRRYPDPFESALALPRELGLLSHIDIDLAWEVVQEAQGIPVRVGSLP